MAGKEHDIVGANVNDRLVFQPTVQGGATMTLKKPGIASLEAQAKNVCDACQRCSMVKSISASGEVTVNDGGQVPDRLVANGGCKLVGKFIPVPRRNIIFEVQS